MEKYLWFLLSIVTINYMREKNRYVFKDTVIYRREIETAKKFEFSEHEEYYVLYIKR